MKIVIYFQDDSYQIGLAEPLSANDYCVKAQNHQEITININRLYLCGDSTDETPNLSTLLAEGQIEANKIDVPAIWKKSLGKTSILAEEIATNHLNTSGLLANLGIFLALNQDKIHFKRKGQEFYPRTEEEVKKRLAEKKKEESHQSELQNTIAYLQSENASLQELPDFATRLVTNLLAYAAENRDLKPEEKKESREFLKYLVQIFKLDFQDFSPKVATQVLLQLKLITDYADLILIRHHQSLSTTKQALQEVRKLAASYNQLLTDKQRKDLSKTHMISIDDSQTMDIDDALSLEQTIDGWTLGIHISDISALIPQNSVLDKIAQKQATSVYTTGQNINMLPKELAENLGSLVANQLRPAVSIFLNLDRQYHLKSSKIFPSLIKVDRKVSYQEADQLLENDDPLISELYQISNQLETQRLQSGAHKSPKKVSDTKFANGQLTLEIYDEHDFSRNIVAEMMIVANKVFAEYAASNFLPAFFRCQDAPEQSSEGTGGNFPEHFKPSFTSLTAKPHHALGLKAYLQATSPIRRYLDLCNQRQIVSHLTTKRACYDRKELEKIKKVTFSPLKEAASASKEIRRYWLLKYLKNNYPKGSIFRATVIKNEQKLGLVNLQEVLISGLVALPAGARPRDEISVRLLEVNPERNDLKLELVS